MSSYGEWVQNVFINVISWLSTHGFVFNNRELAALVWLIVGILILTAFALLKPNIRSTLVGTLKMAVASKLIFVWIVYSLWIILFVLITDWIGIWRTVLTKDTFVWSATAGIALLVGFTEAAKPDYFRREFTSVLSLVVIFEYIVNFATFSLLIEFLLQPLLAFLLIDPDVVSEAEQRETWRRVRSGLLIILLVIVVVHTVQTLYMSWQTVDWRSFALRAVWPMLLGVWVLALVFPLAVVASYEKAFSRLELYSDEREGLWKAKLGLVLALGIQLRLIREAARGGTKHIACAESVGTAYRTAKRYKTKLVAAEHREAAN